MTRNEFWSELLEKNIGLTENTCLASVNPELAKEWHPTKNGDLTPFDITCGSQRKVWWQCSKHKDHVWEAMVRDRNKGKSCPFCSGRKVIYDNCLATVHPELAREWHPTKNGNLTPQDVTAGSSKVVWWQCPICGSEWEGKIQRRSMGEKKCKRCNSLQVICPELASEWHPTKNGDLTPWDIRCGSEQKVWWLDVNNRAVLATAKSKYRKYKRKKQPAI